MFILWGFFLSYRLVLSYSFALLKSQQSADHSAWPVEIQQLIQEHSGLFDPPTQLPPSCGCDHSIPLVPGAAPIFSRPYRFSPTIKDEVEK